MLSVTVNDFEKEPLKYFRNAMDFGYTVNVVGDGGVGIVMLSQEEYSGLLETMYLNSIPGMREKILESANQPGEDFDWKSALSS